MCLLFVPLLVSPVLLAGAIAGWVISNRIGQAPVRFLGMVSTVGIGLFLLLLSQDYWFPLARDLDVESIDTGLCLILLLALLGGAVLARLRNSPRWQSALAAGLVVGTYLVLAVSWGLLYVNLMNQYLR